MTNDALDPGPDGSYPHWPRRPDGSLEAGPGTRMPTGTVRHRTKDGRVVLVDVTPTNTPDGRLDPPPPLGG